MFSSRMIITQIALVIKFHTNLKILFTKAPDICDILVTIHEEHTYKLRMKKKQGL